MALNFICRRLITISTPSVFRHSGWAFLLLWLSSWQLAAAQQVSTLSGTLRSETTGEVLIGATVAVLGTDNAVATNTSGAYTLRVTPGQYRIQFSYIGFKSQVRELDLRRSERLNLALTPEENELQEVVVETDPYSFQERLTRPQMSVETLTAREAKLLPALLGEVDIIKTLQLKPGIQSGGEGSSGLYVRGGGSDQNLVMVDDALVYNPSHLFGFFSVFNPDVVQSVELYKGGFPAQFGGRLSSVLDVKLKEGNSQDFGVSGGIGLIASRLMVEGPINKGKGSFLVAGRRTYVDVFTRLINKASEGNPDYNPIPDYSFHDFNAKANYQLGTKDRLFLSGYLGRDFFKFSDEDFNFNFNWGNRAGSLRWNHQFNPRLFLNTTLAASGYEYEISNRLDVYSFNLASRIRDLTLKSDVEYLPGNGHHYRFGAAATLHQFEIGRLKSSSQDGSVSYGAGSTYDGQDYALYAADEWELSPRLSLSYGLRLSGFRSGGKTYVGLEPRAAASFRSTETLTFKGSFTRMYQYVHLVTNSGASLPTDIWYPSTAGVKPQRSDQVAIGVSKLFADGKFLFSTEAYYKWMKRQIDLRDGAQIFGNDQLEEEFVFGTGDSYGQEFYLEKKEGKTTGWLGYTLSWTYRTFPEVNNGQRYPARFDRRHDISLVILHQLSKRVNLTGAFVYGTGNAYTLPAQRFIMQDVPGGELQVVPVYGERNSFRVANSHRLDIGIVYKLKPKRGTSDLTFSIYNAYNRRNPYFLYFDQIKDENDEQTIGFQAKQVSLFPVIPSVTYNFKF